MQDQAAVENEQQHTNQAYPVARLLLLEAYNEGYLQHAPGCVGMFPSYKCDCGFVKFLKEHGLATRLEVE